MRLYLRKYISLLDFILTILRKKSLFFLHQMFLSSNCRPQNPPPSPEIQSRPSWAARSHDHPVTQEDARSMLRTARWNAGVCPGPARAAVPQLSAEALRASQRSQRSAPSKCRQLLQFLRAECDVTTQQEVN